jgi:hypothetical protein
MFVPQRNSKCGYGRYCHPSAIYGGWTGRGGKINSLQIHCNRDHTSKDGGCNKNDTHGWVEKSRDRHPATVAKAGWWIAKLKVLAGSTRARNDRSANAIIQNLSH